MIDGRDEVLDSSKAEGTMADRFDLVVHPFHGAIRELYSTSPIKAVDRAFAVVTGIRNLATGLLFRKEL